MGKKRTATPAEKARLKALRKKHKIGEFAPGSKKGGSKKGGSKKSSSSKSRSPSKPAASGGSSKNKFTLGKALDLYALGGPALYKGYHFGVSKDPRHLSGMAALYTGFDATTGTFDASRMVRGYGGSINRAVEKKVFKMVRVKPPRSTIKTVGDVLDHVTYFGSTAYHVYENRGNPDLAMRHAYKIQNGVDLGVTGTDAYQPERMIKEKIAPYLAQKLIRKGLRRAGINFGGIF